MFRAGGVTLVTLPLELLDICYEFKGAPECVLARLSVQFFLYSGKI